MTLNHPKEPPLSAGVVKSMRSNKASGTSPEIRMRRALRNAGFPGYRLNWRKAPGRPDICYPGRHVAIFINGCFWHRCPLCNLPLPKHNADYWIPKLERNVERDAEKTRELEMEGWTVITVWECQMKDDMDAVLKEITDVLEKRRPYDSWKRMFERIVIRMSGSRSFRS